MTPEFYHKLVAAFHEHGGGACTKVAEVCGCAVNTARKTWIYGYPELGMPAISSNFSGTSNKGSNVKGFVVAPNDHTSSDHTSHATSAAGPDPRPVLEPASPPAVEQRVMSAPASRAPDGWTDKQWQARQKEPDAILAVQTAGIGVVSIGTRILKRMEAQLEKVMARLEQNAAGEGEDIEPKEYIALFEKVAKILASVAPQLQPVMAAQRLNVGQPQTLGAVAHAHQHTITPGSPTAPTPVGEGISEERRQRFDRLALMHARLLRPVEYDGEEAGIADVEEPDEDDKT